MKSIPPQRAVAETLRAVRSGSDRAAQRDASIIRRIDWQPLSRLRQLILKITQRHSRLSGRHEIGRFMLEQALHLTSAHNQIGLRHQVSGFDESATSGWNYFEAFARRKLDYF